MRSLLPAARAGGAQGGVQDGPSLECERGRADTEGVGRGRPSPGDHSGPPVPPPPLSRMPYRTLLLPLACLLALLVAPAAAHAAAKPVIGYGDQRPEMFSDPLFTQLK